MRITVDGSLSSGEPYEAVIYVPSTFTLLLMKLHAFRDRCQEEEKDLARHHALDIYEAQGIATVSVGKRDFPAMAAEKIRSHLFAPPSIAQRDTKA